jgi:LysM repeat protein
MFKRFWLKIFMNIFIHYQSQRRMKMSITCKYDQLKYPSFLGDLVWQFPVEAKLRLPESLPKIGMIIGGDFQTGPAKITLNEDFIVVSGKVHPQLLFVAELPGERKKLHRHAQAHEVENYEEESGEAEAVDLPQEYGASWPGEAGVDYEERIEVPGIRPGMLVQLDLKALRGIFEKESADQIIFRGNIQVALHPVHHQTAEIITDINAQAPMTINLVKDRVAVEELLETKKVTLPIRSNLVLSNLKPGVARVLKIIVIPNGINQELLRGRLFVRGQLDIELVYVGSDDDGNPTEIFVNGWNRESGSAISFETHIDIDDEEDNDILALPKVAARDIVIETQTPHELHCLMDLDFEVGFSRVYQKELVIDAIPNEEELIDTQKYLLNIEEYIGETSGEVNVEQQIELPSGFASMERVLACSATPEELTVEASDGRALIEGGLNLQLLYISEGAGERNLYIANWDQSTESQLPLAGILEFPGLQPSTLLRTQAVIESMKVEMIDDRRLNLTGVVKFRVLARTPRAIFVIQDCAVVSPVDDTARPSMLFYIVQADDTLWKIARRYQTTMDTLIKANQILSPDNIAAGQKLLIPKKIVNI